MPLQYFQDEKGEWRYRITGDNHEIMVTSEGYASRSNAERGFQDLCSYLDDFVVFDVDKYVMKVDDTDEQARPQETESTEFTGSKHDECPGDNPSALRSDEDGGS